MKRRAGRTARQTAKKQIPVCTASMSQAASTSSSVIAAVGTAAGSGRQRRFTAKRELEILQNLADTDSGSDEESQRNDCLLYTSPSPRDRQKSRMPSSA